MLQHEMAWGKETEPGGATQMWEEAQEKVMSLEQREGGGGSQCVTLTEGHVR